MNGGPIDVPSKACASYVIEIMTWKIARLIQSLPLYYCLSFEDSPRDHRQWKAAAGSQWKDALFLDSYFCHKGLEDQNGREISRTTPI